MSICGIDCNDCQQKQCCKGCEETCGKPFGGACIAAEYIKFGGKESYLQFKFQLLDEINAILSTVGVPKAEKLYELSGAFVNLAYLLPSGESVKFLDDTKIYLGTQIEVPGMERCFGVIADTTFILICSYGTGGTEPEIVLFKHR